MNDILESKWMYIILQCKETQNVPADGSDMNPANSGPMRSGVVGRLEPLAETSIVETLEAGTDSTVVYDVDCAQLREMSIELMRGGVARVDTRLSSDAHARRAVCINNLTQFGDNKSLARSRAGTQALTLSAAALKRRAAGPRGGSWPAWAARRVSVDIRAAAPLVLVTSRDARAGAGTGGA